MAKTRSQIEQEFLDAFSTQMANPTNADKLGVMYKAFMDGGKLITGDGALSVYDITKPYGVIWDDNADTYFRTGHTVPAIQQQMRRCVTVGNPEHGGSVQYFLDKDNSALKEDGSASVLDGSTNLQVRVQVPIHYIAAYKVMNLNYDIVSLTPFEGCKTHERFRTSGWIDSGDGTDSAHEISHAYLGAFEGCHYDATTATVVQGTSAAVTLDLVNDKIYSVAGFKPLTNINIVQSRKLIANGGSKQYSWHDHDMLVRLHLTEFATHNSQINIPGYTENSGANFNDDVLKTGLTISLGNNSGSISGNANFLANGGEGGFDGVVANSFRGIENFYGHLWKWVDGVNFSNGQPFVCPMGGTFASPTNTSDTTLGFTGDYVRAVDSDGLQITQPASGWQGTLHSGTNFVKTIGGSNLSKITDYYYYASGSRVLQSGGALPYGSLAGVSCLYAYYASSYVNLTIGSRA